MRYDEKELCLTLLAFNRMACPMKIIIAPDSFKESLSAAEVAEAIESGFKEIFSEADYFKLPIADGGEGTVDALVAATGGRLVKAEVTAPLGNRITARYGVCGDGRTAVIEMAAASGLMLVPPEQRNPLLATSYGTGELIRHALDGGYKHFIIGIGGSATNDAGIGMLQALGVKFLDCVGNELGSGGAVLETLERIDISGLDPRIADSCIEVACDVTNPLIGDNGASAVFGPQKGATAQMVEELDSCLARFAEVVKRDLGQEIAAVPGAGAAGGMGAALLAFLGAELKPGVTIVLDAIGFEELVKDADLVITGEGRIDGQTVNGKAPAGVAGLAARYNIPVIAFAGSLGEGAEGVRQCGISALFSVVQGPCSLAQALAGAQKNIRMTACRVAAVIALGKRLDKHFMF